MILGDIDGNGKVDIKDLVLLIKAYGSYPGHPQWNSNADINCDGKVDIKDLVLIIRNYGKYSP
ncbi:MAG: dockerin type I domain-containing protein [Candidatus Bathyarchaeota archaeon]|nr:dockerin type I domain-containing protein [Candidatus Bathyarchaeota archaeon]